VDRSYLFAPGHSEKLLGKVFDAGADAVILDLEDAVAATRKAYAREAVAEFLAGQHPVPVLVRINDPQGPEAGADRAVLAGLAGAAGVKVPKVESRRVLTALAARVRVPLHPLIESALGLEAAHAVATHPAVASIGLGEADLRSDLGVDGDEALLWARGRIVVAARAAGLPPPQMSVYPNVTDLDGLADSCAAGRRLGFLGRAAIHPRQLPVIAAAFRPAAQDVARAEALLAALADAQTRDAGTVVLPDGRFADRAMVAAARHIVELAARYATDDGARP
jgi:citrate lyase subunit beta/citryl-CoA lyase